MACRPDVRVGSVAAILVLAATAGACSRPAPSARVEHDASSSPAPAPSADAKPTTLEWRLYEEPSLFTRKLPPQPGDWLARFHETAQSFAMYETTSPVRPTELRNKLVLQPLGAFGA